MPADRMNIWAHRVGDLVFELEHDALDQYWIDTCPSTSLNERVPHGPARGRQVAPPCCGLKICLASTWVEPWTYGKWEESSHRLGHQPT
jgi:hypothetical protein